MSGNLIEMLNSRYVKHPAGCHCPDCERARIFRLLDDMELLRDRRTVDEIIADLAVFSDEQRSLAWSPEPPFESTGAGDCRPGGSCGLDFNDETRRAQWRRARFRMRRELRRSL
jgi:hypothetical protein